MKMYNEHTAQLVFGFGFAVIAFWSFSFQSMCKVCLQGSIISSWKVLTGFLPTQISLLSEIIETFLLVDPSPDSSATEWLQSVSNANPSREYDIAKPDLTDWK
jgi:cbb3-type cytochrome oxidase subunit 1